MQDDQGNVLATHVFGWADRPGEAWWKISRLAFSSPLALACRFENEPMWANALGIRTITPNPQIQQIDISDFARRSMTASAIVLPVHMPFGLIGAASLVPVDQSRVDLSEDFERHADMLGTAVRRFVTSYSRVMGAKARMPLGNDLSSREVECLRWAAVGKTDLEIGMIMSRSRATIRFHMHNAVAKLQSVNRSHAVFKATQLGYLGYLN
ncbi:MAG: helix-turn-helix transcriptional regulator [Novosphingobium sp.]